MKKSSKRKKRHKAILENVRRRISETYPDEEIGDVSNYFEWMSDIAQELQQTEDLILLFARVSHRSQKKRLEEQTETLRKYLEAAGISTDRIIATKRIVCSAFNSEKHKAPPGYSKPHYPQLERIAFWVTQQQRKKQCKILLFFLSVDRAVRSDDYHGDRDSPLTEAELKEFAKITMNLRVVTALRPSCSYQDTKAHRIFDNRITRQNEPEWKHSKYPGWTKDRRRDMLPPTLAMRAEKDKCGNPKYSYGEIAKELRLPIEIVRSWCRKAKSKGRL